MSCRVALAAHQVSILCIYCFLLSTCSGQKWDDSSHVPARLFVAPITKLPMDKYHAARCLDGSPGAYYVLEGDPSRFVINLQGGGSCYFKWTCTARKYTAFGSSNFMSLVHNFAFPGSFADIDPDRNPQLANATMVQVPYCSGDIYSGQRQDEAGGLWFGGHEIIKAIFSELLANHGLTHADSVVLTGTSAGGIGAVLHLDLLADALKEVGNHKAKVVGASIGGLNRLLDQPAYDGAGSVPGFRLNRQNLPIIASGWGAYVPPRCAKAMQAQAEPEWQCLMTSQAAHTLENDVMFFQAQSDAFWLPTYFGVPGQPPFTDHVREYTNGWVNNQRKMYAEVVRPGVAVYAPACWTHTFLEGIRIQGIRYQDAFSLFLQDPKRELLMEDSCGVACNPTCKPSGGSESTANLFWVNAMSR